MSLEQAPLPADADHDSRVKVSPAHKAQLIAIYEFVKAQRLGCTNTTIFRHCGVSRRTGYRILSDAGYGQVPIPRRQSKPKSGSQEPELAIDLETLYHLRLWKDAGGLPNYAATWKQLAVRAGLLGERQVSWRSLKDQLATFEYERRGQQRNKIIDPDVRPTRCNLARPRKVWTQEDWKKIRFSGVGVFGQGEGSPAFHCWAQVGWECKSDLVFLNMAGNEQGAISPEMYIHGILEPHVMPFISPGYILQEEGDMGLDASPGSAVEQWKVAHGLQYYISPPELPELSILRNCWQPVYHFITRDELCDDLTLQQRVLEAWSEVSQGWINEMVLSMPQRVDDVLDSGGKMTKWTLLP